MEINELETSVVENTTGPNAPNIENTDENLSVDAMFQQSTMPSLGKQIFSVVPVHGPTAALFNLKSKITPAQPEILAVQQVIAATPTAASTTLYTLTINGIDYSFTSGAGATLAQITAGLTQEINITQTNGVVPVTATDNGTSISLQADVAGTAFTVVSTGVGIITLVETTPNQVYVAPAPELKDIQLVRAEVAIYPSVSIPTGMTQEAIQDMRNQFGKEADVVIGKMLRGVANDAENVQTLAFLESNALADATLQLTNSINAETNLFEISQRVQELVLKINVGNLRSYEAFAVVPYKVLSGIMALTKYAGGEEEDKRGLFIAQIGQTKFYVNPDAASSTVYVGVKDTENPSKSSAVFSPYKSAIIDAQNPDSGDTVYHLFNRYAITASPLHTLNEEMLHKFVVLL